MIFLLKNRPIHFHINITRVIRPVKRNMLSFSSTKKKQGTSGPSSQYLISQIQVQKPTLVVVTNQVSFLKKIMIDLTKTLKKGWPILRHFEVNISLMDNLYEVKKKFVNQSYFSGNIVLNE